MTRGQAKERLERISTNYSEEKVCAYADSTEAVGFVDISQRQDGSRGIVFFGGAMIFNFDGAPFAVKYSDIERLEIVGSFEDAFADELQISGSGVDIRITDLSLDKSELKSFIEQLRGDFFANSRAVQTVGDAQEELQLDFPENSADDYPVYENSEMPEVKITEDEDQGFDLTDIVFEEGAPVISESLPEDYTPAPIPTGKIDWISRSDEPFFKTQDEELYSENDRVSESTPENYPDEEDKAQANIPEEQEREEEQQEDETPEETRETEHYETAVTSDTEVDAQQEIPDEETAVDDDDTDEYIRIQNMTTEETLAFLSESLNEINSVPPPVPETENTDEPASGTTETEEKRHRLPEFEVKEAAAPALKLSDYATPAEEVKSPAGLTIEPIWGDIYIKASRNLRELCESGRITMEQIEKELRDKLLDSARAFAEVTANPSKIPKVLIPKITELKAASYNFDMYFRSGEDIAVRAMFFMLYQMLSYADRIAETPETKERLNDFFRRFGPAGITLSMLDVRV